MSAPIVWLTGPPAAGKSTIAERVVTTLRAGGEVVWLDSDVLRQALTPRPTYSEDERDFFYGTLVEIAARTAASGVPVIISATAPRRRYRDALRARHAPFFEVLVSAPLEELARRDPKGLYRAARAGAVDALPGVGAAYEPPLAPELIVSTDRESLEEGAAAVLALLERARR